MVEDETENELAAHPTTAPIHPQLYMRKPRLGRANGKSVYNMYSSSQHLDYWNRNTNFGC